MRYTTPYYTSNYYTYVEATEVPILPDGVALDLRIVTTAGDLATGQMLGAESALHGILTGSGTNS